MPRGRQFSRSRRTLRDRTARFEQLDDRRLLAVDFELLKDINTTIDPAGSDPANIVEVGSVAFFSAITSSGAELWKTDGTEAGTVRVKDIFSGPVSSYPRSLTNVNGKIYFAANDGVSGAELWKSDGIEVGTMLVEDFNGGGRESFPEAITEAGSRFFVVARTEEFGRELWVADLAPTVPGDFDADSDVDGADFHAWQREDASSVGLSDWQSNFGDAPPVAALATGAIFDSTLNALAIAVVEPTPTRGEYAPAPAQWVDAAAVDVAIETLAGDAPTGTVSKFDGATPQRAVRREAALGEAEDYAPLSAEISAALGDTIPARRASE